MTSQQTLPVKNFATPKSFEAWLAKNHSNSYGVWLLLAKKNAEKPTITYAEALDVALCYGWIDSLKKKYDEQYSIQKFSPRKAKSIWSKKNIEHTERLEKNGKMQPAGLQAIEDAKANGAWERAYDAQRDMTIPNDFLKAIKKNKTALAFFKTLNRTNLFSIGFRLQTAKKEETRVKRIAAIINKLEREEKFH